MRDCVSEARFRDALAHFASGVTVVTARGQAGPVGFTATSFTSVSIDPPLVLVCVAKTAGAHEAVVASARFGVSILAERQEWIAAQFARSGVDRFYLVPLWGEGPAGVPLVDGAIVHLECSHHAAHPAGDHTILVGEVVTTHVSPGRPLLRYRRHFGAFA
jgi:flavin reductase (DIM6/NTAB) family NADH-FMN oxidoreductase RutF